MPETLELRLGEERPVHLPADGAPWTCDVGGMASAVDVRKLWAADPYPEDDEEDEADRPPPDVVYMVKGVNPGEATLRFTPGGGSDARDVVVRVAT
jgi:hypothetical protein